MTKPLLIVANTPSANTEVLAAAVNHGAQRADALPVRLLPPLLAQVEDVLTARAIIIGTTENFGYMSGQIKDFFERIYYPCLEHTPALPWALYVRAGKDGAGALRGVQSIVTGLRWREIQPPLLLRGEYQESFVKQCETLGMTVAAGMELGLF